MAENYVPPVELVRCAKCGCLAKLHKSRSRKWYVRCSKEKEHRTEEVVSRITVCKLWNVRNRI